jgi:hypothetical protein
MKQFEPSFVVGILMAFLLSAALMQTTPVFAQDPASADTNMQILRDKVKADKKLVVAANMELTDAEAKGFWPVYEGYQKDLQSLNERMKKTILSYADGYNNKTLTDEKAKQLSDEALAIDEQEIKMRRALATKLAPILPAKKSARYMQIENKIRAALRYELAGGIPLVE